MDKVLRYHVLNMTHVHELESPVRYLFRDTDSLVIIR